MERKILHGSSPSMHPNRLGYCASSSKAPNGHSATWVWKHNPTLAHDQECHPPCLLCLASCTQSGSIIQYMSDTSWSCIYSIHILKRLVILVDTISPALHNNRKSWSTTYTDRSNTRHASWNLFFRPKLHESQTVNTLPYLVYQMSLANLLLVIMFWDLLAFPNPTWTIPTYHAFSSKYDGISSHRG